jgi:hypothetical protein
LVLVPMDPAAPPPRRRALPCARVGSQPPKLAAARRRLIRAGSLRDACDCAGGLGVWAPIDDLACWSAGGVKHGGRGSGGGGGFTSRREGGREGGGERERLGERESERERKNAWARASLRGRVIPAPPRGLEEGGRGMYVVCCFGARPRLADQRVQRVV